MDIQEIRKIASRIKGSIFKNSNNYSVGMLKSHFRGSGLQFKEHQVYTHGDDIRRIDWSMYAKKNSPYIKTFEEERNIIITVLIDCQPTMLLGYNGISKLQAAIEITCLLYLLVKETGDYIRPIILAENLVKLPESNGEKGLSLFIDFLRRLKVLNELGQVDILRRFDCDISEMDIMKKIMYELRKQREVVVLSDFDRLFDETFLVKLLKKSRMHCFKILSPVEQMEKIPYALRLKGLNNKKEIFYGRSKGLNSHENFKRLKVISVEKRYLEIFVKEML